MAYLFLDPNKIPSNCSECTDVPPAIPQKVRELKHLPDRSLLLPGDLILISPQKPSFIQKQIRKAQLSGGYSDEDAHWTHAAVYLGFDFNICEATRKGVHQASLLDSLDTHLVRVRRDPTLDSDTRWKIAVAAALQIGTKYGIASALKIGFRSIKGLHNPQKAKTQSSNELICSELYADAFLFATGKTLQDTQAKEVSPAFLSYVDYLEDVPLAWRKIPGR